MNKAFYLSCLLFGLTACNNSTEQSNAPKQENNATEQVDSKSEPQATNAYKQKAKKNFALAFLDNDGNVSFQFDESLANEYAEMHMLPNRLDGSVKSIEGFNHKCKMIEFFGGNDDVFLGMLTEEGKVAIIDLVRTMETGDTRCSDILTKSHTGSTEDKPLTATSIESEKLKTMLYTMTTDGENIAIQPFSLPGYYMHNDFEICLTRDFRIYIASPSADIFKSGTFYSDPNRTADGPDAQEQVLVANFDGKQYEISFGYDHFELPDNDEKRNDYYFVLNSDDFALNKGVNLTFKRHNSSQIAN